MSTCTLILVLVFGLTGLGNLSASAQKLDRSRLQQLKDQPLEEVPQAQQSTRRRAFSPVSSLSTSTNTIGGITEITQTQSWIRNSNPNPRLNFDLTGTPQYAGDVNGDGVNDYLYTTPSARDERTSALEDKTSKTALFYGGSPLQTEDQLVYSHLRPAGDLNNDGYDDAVVLLASTNTVQIYEGSGSGYSDSGVSRSLSRSAQAIVGFTDLDGDGYEDVVLYASDDSGFEVLFGAGTLSNATLKEYTPSAPSGPFAHNAADLDGDGQGQIVRLAGENPDVQVQVFSVDGSRALSQSQSFTTSSIEGSASGNNVALVDVNGDGPRELITTTGFRTPSYVFAGSADSSFVTPSITFQEDDARPVGDLNQDGNHDFYVYEDSTDTRYVAFGPDNLADGLSFDTEISYASGVSGKVSFLPYGKLGDVTDDGRLDVVLGYDEKGGKVGRRFFNVNTFDGSARSPTDVTYNREYFFDRINEVNEIGDFNNDGTTDFAVVRDNLSRVEVFYGGSSISSSPDLTITPPSTVSHVSSGDLNNSGASDLIVGGQGSGRIDIYFGGSNPDATADHSILASDVGFPIHIPRVVGDINDDGYADWVATDRGLNDDFSVTGQNVAIFFGGSTLPTTADQTLQYGDGQYLGEVKAGIGDVNGDGIDDFAFNNPIDSKVDVYYGDSSPSFSTPADLSVSATTTYPGIAGGDFNGDGDSDLAVLPYRGSNGGEIRLFYGGSDFDATADQTLLIPADIGGGDQDGDGFADNTIGVLESPGDVDGNGADELIHGSSFFGFGKHALLYRPSTSREPIRVFRGPNSDAPLGSQQFIYSAAMADVTGNDTTDFVASQFNDNNDAYRSSRVYRYPTAVPSKSPRIAAPSNLTASSAQSSIDLDWDAVSDTSLASYHVYRTLDPVSDTTNPADLAPYDSVSGDNTTFSDTDVPAVDGYYYRVTAVDSAGGESFFSSSAQAAIPIPQTDFAAVADYEDAQRDTAAAGGTTIRADSADFADASNGIAALEVDASGSGSVTFTRKASLPKADRLSFLLKPDVSTNFTLTLTFVEDANGTEVTYDVQLAIDSGEAWQRFEVPFSDVGAGFNPVAPRAGGDGPLLRLEASANKDVTYHIDELEFGTEKRALVELTDFERTTLAYGPQFCDPTFSDTTVVAPESDGYTARVVSDTTGCFGYNYGGSSNPRLFADLQGSDVLSFRATSSPGDSLYVFLETSDDEFRFKDGKKIPLPDNRWGVAKVPIQELGGNPQSLKDPGLYNVGFETKGSSPTVQIDDIKLMGRAGPGAPSGLAGTVLPDTVDLSWSAPSSGTADKYYVYRDTTAFDPIPGPGVYTPIDTVGGSTTSLSDTTVTPGVTYHYRVAAVDANGNKSRLSNEIQKYAEGLAASVSKTISGDGTETFPDTGTELNFSGVGSSGDVTVNRYIGEPSSPDGIDKQNVSAYRLTIDAESGLDFTSAQVRLSVSTFSGINDPSNVTIYKRDTPGSGSFDALTTTVGDNGTSDDVSDDTLYASTSSFSEFALGSDTEPLPVELASFEAQTNKDAVRLTWTTASEKNNARFHIQRRKGASNEKDGPGTQSSRQEASAAWTTLGSVEGEGTTSEAQSYRFTDANLPYEANALTYRLKQVDTDGSVHYSDPISVNRGIDDVELLGTYPNPARQRTTMRYAIPKTKESGGRHVTIRLYDVLGRRVRTLVDSKKVGRQKQQIDVRSLPSGVYFLRLRAQGKIRTQKLTVVR